MSFGLVEVVTSIRHFNKDAKREVEYINLEFKDDTDCREFIISPL